MNISFCSGFWRFIMLKPWSFTIDVIVNNPLYISCYGSLQNGSYSCFLDAYYKSWSGLLNKFLSIHVVHNYPAFLPVQDVVYDYERLILVYWTALQSHAQLHDYPIRLKFCYRPHQLHLVDQNERSPKWNLFRLKLNHHKNDSSFVQTALRFLPLRKLLSKIWRKC